MNLWRKLALVLDRTVKARRVLMFSGAVALSGLLACSSSHQVGETCAPAATARAG
jgi:hypothetical protein